MNESIQHSKNVKQKKTGLVKFHFLTKMKVFSCNDETSNTSKTITKFW